MPRVYACQAIAVDDARTLNMFLGEWFASCREFHVSKTSDRNINGIRVWDPENEHVFLSPEQAQAVYEQAAMILTACYNLETFEQISAWHHAAGDFVVTFDEQRMPQVKLVTIRDYTPMLAVAEESAEAVLNGLLLFLLSMSIHMRLDRLDGVGEMVWIDDVALEGTLAGFFKGLELQLQGDRIPAGFIDYIKTFLTAIPAADIRELFVAMADRLPPDAPDLPIINAHLEGHADAFCRMMQTQF